MGDKFSVAFNDHRQLCQTNGVEFWGKWSFWISQHRSAAGLHCQKRLVDLFEEWNDNSSDFAVSNFTKRPDSGSERESNVDKDGDRY